jgi:hypothetical protein
MELSKKLRNDDRLTRTLLAVGLSVFALLSVRRGKRLRGVLAGLGAVALGYGAVTESGDVVEHFAEEFATGSTTEDEQRRCAICGDPIVAGQSRTPNENDETVHEACLESPA